MDAPKPATALALLDSIQALRNWRAWILLLIGFLLFGTCAYGCMHLLANGSDFLARLLETLGLLLLLFFWSATGFIFMAEQKGEAHHTVASAVISSLFSFHRLVGLLLILLCGFLLVVLVVVLLLLLCLIPVVGPVLFAVVLPASRVVIAIAMLLVVLLVWPVFSTGVWENRGVAEGLTRLAVVCSNRFWRVVGRLAVLGGIAWLAVLIEISALAVSGAFTRALGAKVGIPAGGTVNLSAAIGAWVSALAGLGDGTSASGFQYFADLGPHALAYAHAAVFGGTVLLLVLLIVPTLIWQRGLCAVAADLAANLDLEAGTRSFRQRLATLRARSAPQVARVPSSGRSSQSSAPAVADAGLANLINNLASATTPRKKAMLKKT